MRATFMMCAMCGSLSLGVSFPLMRSISGPPRLVGSSWRLLRGSFSLRMTSHASMSQGSRDAVVPASTLPVTLISGFLGAGKTTLLQNMLRNTEGLRIAVIVNDMADINIDAKLIKATSKGDGAVVKQLPEKLVELENGCICCSLREDLLEEVKALAQEGSYDHLVIESSGVSNPVGVAETFFFEDEEGSGRTLNDAARLDTLVTVVDSTSFLAEVREGALVSERGFDTTDPEGSMSELLINQVEFANVVLLNKSDLVPDEETANLEAVISRLNPTAKVLKSQECAVPLSQVLGTGVFDFEEASSSPGWAQELSASDDQSSEGCSVECSEGSSECCEDSRDRQPQYHHDLHGVTSITYRARKPFHPARLMDFVCTHMKDIVRSKGFFWLASRHETMGIWSQAGGSFTSEPGGSWWASMKEEDWGCDEEDVPDILSDFRGDWGDRRQELVFIGSGMEEDQLRLELERCLLTDEEMKAGPSGWAALEDDFPPWDYQG